ncbi:VaFE repeat-containing surface-anchored protein [Paracoccus stylophorae]|uniref:VaFE repeat-containing surface-anchored protein n=1 Tax=Paracoccus stylophorae TaxID=659350 RepID=A0ABY7SV56_9RHOB|nr:VaFE repeat-containing surface-anchored protein [Paracoccus stylophorae]WCR10056.1 VaFE repeat-containing surface-anchored protein [Paracoccus stylophorae]
MKNIFPSAISRSAAVATFSVGLACSLPFAASAQDAVTLDGVAIDAADDNRFFTRLGGTVRDDVSYSGLQPGQDYTLTAVLIDPATGQEAGQPVSHGFTADAAQGSVSIELPVAPNRTPSNQDFVVALKLFAGPDGSGDPLAEAADPDDADQAIQVHAIQSISVTAADAADGDSMLDPAGGTIAARVQHRNLVAGYSYTIWGQLLSASGQSTAIYASIPEYVPTEMDGEVTLEFTVPEGFEGVRLVPSVGLYHANRVTLGDDGWLTYLPDAPNPVMIASDPDVQAPAKLISIGTPFEDLPADDG